MVSGRVTAVNDHQLIVDTEQGHMVGLLMDSRTMIPGDVAPGTIVRAEFRMMQDGRPYATRVQSISTSAADREQAYAHTSDEGVAYAQNVLDCGSMDNASRGTTASNMNRRSRGVDAEFAQSTTGSSSTQTSTGTTNTRTNDSLLSRPNGSSNSTGTYGSNGAGSTSGSGMNSTNGMNNSSGSGNMNNGSTNGNNGNMNDNGSMSTNGTNGANRGDRLPRTASNQPLLLIAGLLAVAGAGAMLASRRRRRGSER
jgi:LPXTG-motif cell wall-anchored protein